MVKNQIKAGMLTIDLELIATGNSYRIFETKASRIDSLTKADDISWRLYFEPQSNQIDYQDMQKLQFTSYSESQWTISPPSLKRFITDFKNVAKDQALDAEIINFKSSWTFTRDKRLAESDEACEHFVHKTLDAMLRYESNTFRIDNFDLLLLV